MPLTRVEGRRRRTDAEVQAIIEGVKPDDITIVLHEVPAENWGIRGGQPASEVELGFEVKV